MSDMNNRIDAIADRLADMMLGLVETRNCYHLKTVDINLDDIRTEASRILRDLLPTITDALDLDSQINSMREDIIRQQAEIERLRADLAESKHCHSVQMQNAWQERQKAESLADGRKAARHLYSLWPAEYFGTLQGILDDYPWLEEEQP